MAATLDFTSFFTMAFMGAAPFFTAWLFLIRSRHTVVCRAAQEAGAPHREYIDRKNKNVIFTPLYLGDHLSDWNQICYTVARQPRESTFQI